MNLCIFHALAFCINNPFFLILKGEKDFLGYNINYFKAYRYNQISHQWDEILIQIDEKNIYDEYVLDEGIPYTKNTDDKIFDLNDEMVFKITDFNDCFTLENIPSNIKQSAKTLWKITLFVNNSQKCILLAYLYNISIQITQKTLVHYDVQNQTITTSKYKYVFNKEYPALLGQTYFLNGINTKNLTHLIIKNSEFNIFLKTKWFLPNIFFSKDDFTSSIECWKTGPIRTIIAVGLKYKALLSLIKLHFFSELIFYENSFQIPTIIEFPINAQKILKPGSGMFYFASFDNFKQYKISTNLQQVSNTDELMKLLALKSSSYNNFYALLQKDNVNLYLDVNVEKKALDLVPPPLIFYKNSSFLTSFRSNWINFTNFDIGIYIDFSNVKKDIYKFNLNIFMIDDKELGVLKNIEESDIKIDLIK